MKSILILSATLAIITACGDNKVEQKLKINDRTIHFQNPNLKLYLIAAQQKMLSKNNQTIKLALLIW